MKYPMMVLAAAALAASATAAPIVPGTPITTPPAGIVALGGQVVAVYMFADAGHTDILNLLMPPPAMPTIFCNHALSGTCSANSPGDTVSLGTRSGLMEFTLKDHNTGNTFISDMADPDGNFHAFVTTTYSDFGVGAMDPAAAAALVGLTNITFVGWEDKTIHDPNPDWDYNDLIFAFSATRPTHQDSPEPLTLALVGAGLMGAFGLRRVKKS